MTGNTSWNASTYSFYFFGSNSTTNYSNMNVNQKAKQQSFAWLFDYTYGCISYGCNYADYSIYNLANSTSNKNYSYGYWTITSVGIAGSDYYEWIVLNEGWIGYNYSNSSAYGLRPVITLPKEMFE